MTYEDWEYLDARALNTIHFCLEDEVLFNIIGDETTTILWNRLESLYMENFLMNKIFLKKKLYSLWMTEGTTIVDHLIVFNTLICQLSSMEVKYKDEDKKVTLLCSLSESWDHMVTSMWSISIDSIDYDIVVGALSSKEMRRISSKETLTIEAMVVIG
jgi:hypothetical protein